MSKRKLRSEDIPPDPNYTNNYTSSSLSESLLSTTNNVNSTNQKNNHLFSNFRTKSKLLKNKLYSLNTDIDSDQVINEFVKKVRLGTQPGELRLKKGMYIDEIIYTYK